MKTILNKHSYKSFQVSPGTMHLFVNEMFNIFVVVWAGCALDSDQ